MNLEKLFYRIILGYYFIEIDNIEYKVLYPNLDIKYKAEILYDKILEDNKYDKRWLTKKEIDFFLNIHNIWNKKKEENLVQANKLLEDLKIEIYLNFVHTDKKSLYKKQIKNTISNIHELNTQKNSMNHLGVEEYAFTIKNEYIAINTIYYKENLFFTDNNMDNYDSQELQVFLKGIMENMPSIDDLRNLVKADLWKSYANIANLNKDFLNINDDYRHLISLHKMYDNVKQHPECPSDDIIEDDDALDGWFLYQNRKIQKEKKKNSILDKFGGKVKNANEVFLLTDNIQETKDIYDLNDPNEKRKIKEFIQVANTSKEEVSWQNLPYVQRELQQQVNDKFKGIMKKEK